MIKLLVEDYCQDCANFDPAACTNTVMREGGEDQVVTQVYCKQRQMCARLVRRYKDKEKGDE